MSLRALSPSELLVAVKTHIAYVNLQDSTIEKFDLPEEKPVRTDNEEQEPVTLPPGIQNMSVSPDNTHVAISTRQKYLYVYRLESRRPLKLEQVAKTTLTRVSNRLRFSADSQQLLVADKTGDCFAWKFSDSTVLEPICGHLSMVMDVFFNADQSALITCDRDEKIRVTSYPDIHNILAYCMGHREYVAQMELVPHNPQWLLSISGDHTVRVWDYKQGKEICQLPLAGAGALMDCWKSSENTSVIACNIYQSNVLQIFEVESNGTGDGLLIKGTREVQLAEHTYFKAIDHYAGGLVTLTMIKEGEKIVPQVEVLAEKEGSYSAVDLSAINALLREEFTDLDTEDRDDVAILFKKRVNNISHYHERKRKRIEERSK